MGLAQEPEQPQQRSAPAQEGDAEVKGEEELEDGSSQVGSVLSLNKMVLFIKSVFMRINHFIKRCVCVTVNISCKSYISVCEIFLHLDFMLTKQQRKVRSCSLSFPAASAQLVVPVDFLLLCFS